MARERKSGHRIEQLESTLRRAVQQVLARGLSDPRSRGMISVTQLKLSRDIREATVMVSVFPEEHQELTFHAIKHAARHIRREAGELVALEKMPELHFKLDLSLKRQAELFDALGRLNREREDGALEADEPGGDASEKTA